jgi:predicted CoA-binding protein
MSYVSRILRENQVFAVVGATQNKDKYGHEVVESLVDRGYLVYPVNPNYKHLNGHTCYPSVADLPEKPQVVVTVVPPDVTEQVIQSCAQLGVKMVWMPPGTWSDQAIEYCETNGTEEIHDICLVFALDSLGRGVAV